MNVNKTDAINSSSRSWKSGVPHSQTASIQSMRPSSSVVEVSSLGQILPWISLIASMTVAVALILSGDGRLPLRMDQAFADVDLHIYHNGTNWIFQYPVLSWSGGITGSLLVGVYKLIVPTSPETLNWHVKIFAAGGFLVSLFWLAKTYLRNWLDQFAILSIAVTSGLLYLEPSTELFAGASLNLFAVAIRSDRRTLLQALTLAVFSLIKIELLPIGAMVAIFWVVTSHQSIRRRLAFLLSFGLTVAALIALSIHFHGYQTVFLGHDMNAFEWHYCYLFHGDSETPCLARDMPDVRTFSDIVRNHTEQYLSFVWASLLQSARYILLTLNLLVLSVPLLIAQAFRLGENGDRVISRLTLLVLAMTCSIATLLAFVHPRFLTRSFGLLLVASALALREAAAKQRQQRLNVLVLALTIIIVVLNLMHLPAFLAEPHHW
jgi:hypothetical protein